MSTVDVDVLFHHATIVDGTGRPAFTGDLAVKDGKILAIGTHLGGTTVATRDVDASGKVCRLLL